MLWPCVKFRVTTTLLLILQIGRHLAKLRGNAEVCGFLAHSVEHKEEGRVLVLLSTTLIIHSRVVGFESIVFNNRVTPH